MDGIREVEKLWESIRGSGDLYGKMISAMGEIPFIDIYQVFKRFDLDLSKESLIKVGDYFYFKNWYDVIIRDSFEGTPEGLNFFYLATPRGASVDEVARNYIGYTPGELIIDSYYITTRPDLVHYHVSYYFKDGPMDVHKGRSLVYILCPTCRQPNPTTPGIHNCVLCGSSLSE